MWPKLGEIPFAEFWEMVLTWHTHSQTHWRTDRPENRIPPAPKIVGGGGTKTVVIHCTAKRQFLYGVLSAKPVVRLSETDKLLLRLVHTADSDETRQICLVSTQFPNDVTLRRQVIRLIKWSNFGDWLKTRAFSVVSTTQCITGRAGPGCNSTSETR